MYLLDKLDKKFEHPEDQAGLINPANVFTIARVPAAILGVWLFISGQEQLGAWIIIIASLSDFLDGVVARVFRCKTDFGRLLDPVADKIMMGIIMVFLLTETGDQANLRELLLLILLYEIIIATATLYWKFGESYDIFTTYIGKKAMFARMMAVCGAFLVVSGISESLRSTVIIVGYIGLILGFAAGAQYVIQGRLQTKHGELEKLELWPHGYNTATARFLADPFGLKQKLGLARD